MNIKKIALFGTSGQLLRRVAEEALKRGHSVTTIILNPNELKLKHPKFDAFAGDLMNRSEVSKYAKGHDVVICLHEPLLSKSKWHIEANRAIIEGARNAGVQRIVSLGHPVSIKLERSKAFFDLWKPVAEAQRETLKIYKNEHGLHWAYLHSVDLSPSEKSIVYSVSDEIILSNPEGKNKIDSNMLIDALLSEAEKTEYLWETSELRL